MLKYCILIIIILNCFTEYIEATTSLSTATSTTVGGKLNPSLSTTSSAPGKGGKGKSSSSTNSLPASLSKTSTLKSRTKFSSKSLSTTAGSGNKKVSKQKSTEGTQKSNHTLKDVTYSTRRISTTTRICPKKTTTKGILNTVIVPVILPIYPIAKPKTKDVEDGPQMRFLFDMFHKKPPPKPIVTRKPRVIGVVRGLYDIEGTLVKVGKSVYHIEGFLGRYIDPEYAKTRHTWIYIMLSGILFSLMVIATALVVSVAVDRYMDLDSY